MKKIKLSVGVLAFIGLAALNFTQSESCLVSKSHAANTCCNDTITSSDVSTSTSSTSTSSTSSDNSSSGSDVSGKPWDCVEKSCICTYYKEVPVKRIDENGNEIETIEKVPCQVTGYYETCQRMDGGRFKSCKKANCDTTVRIK